MLIQGVSASLWISAHAVSLQYMTVLVDKHQASFVKRNKIISDFSLRVTSITELWTLIHNVNDLCHQSKGKLGFFQINCRSCPEVNVLDNFSLQIEAGSKVALVGPESLLP